MREKPFLEHPTGDYNTSVEAMEEAIRRLREIPECSRWITFCAQGAGAREDSYHLAEIRLLKDRLDAGIPLDVALICQEAGVDTKLISAIESHYSIAAATPREAARFIDALFRHHLGIRPFPDEGDNYAFGAEWA